MGKRVRPRAGDVIAIPLGGGRFAFGRLLLDCGIAIYDYRSKSIPDVTSLSGKPIRFHASIFTSAISNGSWPRIGHLPAIKEANDWPPPCFIRDDLREDSYEIYERGKRRRATKDEVHGLEEQCMWYPEPFVKELKRRFRSRN